VYAARRRTVASTPTVALSIEFVDVGGTALMAAGSDAWVDLATVSQQAGSMAKSVRIRRQVGIRVVRAGVVSWGTATVTARLNVTDGRSSVRIDGQAMTTAPTVVTTRAAIGALTIYTIEIEVAGSATDGPLEASIAWEVTTQ
jgi:hypothetical protein